MIADTAKKRRGIGDHRVYNIHLVGGELQSTYAVWAQVGFASSVILVERIAATCGIWKVFNDGRDGNWRAQQIRASVPFDVPSNSVAG